MEAINETFQRYCLCETILVRVLYGTTLSLFQLDTCNQVWLSWSGAKQKIKCYLNFILEAQAETEIQGRIEMGNTIITTDG